MVSGENGFRIKSFKPVIDKNSRVLILGSMPGNESLRLRQYYAHPRNLFWPLIYNIFGCEPQDDYDLRISFLMKKGIALWDVYKSCTRNGSLDNNIRNEELNDVAGLIKSHPGINVVFCNGGEAEKQFRTNILNKLNRPILYKRLYSTSPANASIPFQKKYDNWLQIRRALEGRILYEYILNSRIGTIKVYSDGSGIVRVILPGGNDISNNSYAIFPEDELSEKAGNQIIEYFNGTRKSFSVPVNFEGTEFEKKIYALLKEIPYGTTVSYSKLAVMAGRKGAARAVGQAVRNNPVPILIPCHRVVASSGKTIGFMGIRGNSLQNELLQMENNYA